MKFQFSIFCKVIIPNLKPGLYMKIKYHIIFISVVALLYSFGCSSSGKTENKNSINNIMEYSIIIGSGGGFTGSYDGHLIDSLGQVFRWSGKTFTTADLTSIGKLSEVELQSAIKSIKESDIMNTSFKEHGNVTTFIRLKKSELEYSVSWIGLEPDNKVPENIRELYSRLKKIIDSLKN